MLKVFKRVSKFNEIGIILAYVILVIVFTIANPLFLTSESITNILRLSSFTLIVGLGTTMIFIIGGIDLSVGSVMGLGGMITGLTLEAGLPIPLAVIAGLLLGVGFGLLNGFMIVKVKMPALIVTLGTMYIAKGITFVLTQGAPVFPLPEEFNVIGNGSVGGLQYVVIISLVLAVITFLILRYTIFGRCLFAIGGNEETSRLSGVNVSKIKMSVYVISAVTAALSGILMSARLGSAQPGTGDGWEMTVIASVIIGGTSMFGGSGTVIGTVFGTLLMCSITTGLVLMGLNVYFQNVAIGLIMLLAVAIDQYRRRKSGDVV